MFVGDHEMQSIWLTSGLTPKQAFLGRSAELWDDCHTNKSQECSLFLLFSRNYEFFSRPYLIIKAIVLTGVSVSELLSMTVENVERGWVKCGEELHRIPIALKQELFAKLEETLVASWDLMYQEAKKYRAANGDLNVPRRYVTPDGYSLGSWLCIQRMVRDGKVGGVLTEGQIALLDELGMRWESADDESWSRCYEAAKEYYEAHGDLNMKAVYVTSYGLRLGYWLSRLRQYRKGKIRSAYLTPEREAALDAIGMTWDVPDYLFERNYAAALAYYKEHEDLDVPVNYVDGDGIRLGVWLNRLRSGRKAGRLTLTEEQVKRLDELGMIWGGRNDLAWEKTYLEAKRYRAQHGNLNVPTRYRTENGHSLGIWLRSQRVNLRRGKLSAERKQYLDELGMDWGKEYTDHLETSDVTAN